MINNEFSVNSLLETIQQAKQFLFAFDAKNYQLVINPHFSSSAGAHMRHILDHYFALMDGVDSGVVNYNKRNRHASYESCPEKALSKWQEVEAWLLEICNKDIHQELEVICEISVNETQNTSSRSSLGRELVFVSSHAIHHFSLLSAMSSLLGMQTESTFGLAPSTASYLREQA
ncbi:hypothetical protein [Paraglaciecola sp. L3A3]|uniref:hypothetical protein n=1 Tax=Paraglaciecola sp. L3A3 TaxID=2686358 RepID=UPI00131C6B26|nr:hypothetical protein [Paraglaciecola sp. L3A3]